MSSFNFRLYGDQIYGLSQKYLNEYISPEIEKEDFLEKFKSGKLLFENLSTKKQIQINQNIQLDELNIQKIDVNIPNETENLSIYLNNVKAMITLLEINNDEIEKMIIDERKNLIEKFKAFVINQIEKKEKSKSFLEGLIESFVNRAINGLSLDLNNIELILKYKKYIFIFEIQKLSYSEENGVKLENISLLFEEDLNRKVIINQFNIIAEINSNEKKDIKNEENINENVEENNDENKENKENNNTNEDNGTEAKNNKNQINITMSNFEFELNQNIFYAINDILDLFNNIEYQKIFLRYKKLIQFHRPKQPIDNQDNPENKEEESNIKQKDYISLWYYTIKTVIKLQKYIGHKKDYIFDLIESSQIKISKKFLENNSNNENILLPNEVYLLKSTKDNVENQLLENKKGSGLTKAFSFFFGGGGDDDKKELTEEEKEELDDIYTDSYIIKYLVGVNENKSDDSNPLLEKINKFISNTNITIKVEKIELILVDINLKENEQNYKCNLFIKEIQLNLNIINKNYDFEMNINDIGSLLNESLFSDRLDDAPYLIQVRKEPNNKMIKLNLGFNCIVINEEIFIFILSYFYSLKFKNKQKIFHKINYSLKNNENKPLENEKNKKEEIKDEFTLFDNFSISHIPSLSLLNSDDNKIEFNLKNYSLNKNLLSFTLNIIDSFGTILDDYTFNFKREKIDNKLKFQCYFEETLNIILSKKSTFFMFITYLKLKTISEKFRKKSKNRESEEDKKEENINLFCLNFVEYKNVEIEFNNYILDIIVNEINIEINEKKCRSFLAINNLILKYENKDLFFKTEKIEISTDYLSTIILYILDFKSKDYDQYEKIIENNLNISEDSIDNLKNQLINNDENCQNKDKINYNNVTTTYNLKIRDIITSLKLEINLITFSVKIGENNVCIIISNIQGNNNKEVPNIINISLNDANLYIEKSNNLNEKFNILNINNKTFINYKLDNNLIKIKIDSPKLNIFKSIFISIFNDIKFLLDQIDWDIIICKSELELLNTSIGFSIFNSIISYIYVSNYDGKSTDTLYLKINDFLLKNEKSINIFEEQELLVNYTIKSKNEDYIFFKFTNIKLNISQNDMCFFFSLFELNSNEDQHNPIYKINNMNLMTSINESQVILGEKNNNLEIKNINNINKNQDYKENNNKEKEYHLIVEGGMHNINLGICLNDYTKKSDLNISNIELNLKNDKIKNIEKNKFENLIEYKLIVNKILLKYFDDYNNEIILLNYNNEQKKGIKIISNNNNNQFEIISQKNLTKININKNEIIIRIDCFLLLYNFFKQSLPKKESINEDTQIDFNRYSNNENLLDNKTNNIEKEDKNSIFNINNYLHIEINFNKTKLQLQTSLDGKEYINLILNDFSILCNPFDEYIDKTKIIPSKNELNTANINIKLGYISSSIISENHSKSLFYTKNEFMQIKFIIIDENINIEIYLGTLIINLSYQDIICILNAYLLNKKLIESINNLSQIEPKYKERKSIFQTVGTLVQNKKAFNIKSKLIFAKFDFILVDNSYGSYQPFLSGALSKISINYQEEILDCNFNILLSSYNYISCIWEPIFENIFIKLNFENQKNDNKLNLDFNEIFINLSDMAISSTLIILQHWIEKFPSDYQRYLRLKLAKNNVIQFNDEVNIKSKITNNTILNYTGMDLNIKYYNNKLKCPKESNLELDYINEWDISQFGPKKITVSFSNNKNDFNIFIEKLGIYEYYYNNYNNYLIAENTLSKDRKINISIYSPMIIKNKTFDSFKITFTNQSQGIYSLLLKSNDIIGIPLNYYRDDTLFNLNIINKKNLDEINNQINQNKINFKLKDFIECNDENEAFPTIPFGEKIFHMKLIKKVNNLKEILISFQYCIVNCLPCQIIIENRKENKCIKIKRFTQHFIDFYSEPDTELIFKIKIGGEYFSSVSTKYFKMTKKQESGNHYFTIFYNQDKTQSFKLSIQHNKSKNTNLLIIYSDSILYNDSGNDFIIKSKYENSPLCFDIGNKLYLISNQIKDIKKAWIQLANNKFVSKNITLDEIIESKPFYKLKLEKNEFHLDLIIKTSISFIPIRNNPSFKENIMTMIYRIYPICRISNLLKSKNIFISEKNNNNNKIIINTLQQINFNFFEKGNNIVLLIGLLNIGDNKCTPPLEFKLTQYGIFSFCRENFLFNIEVKESTIAGIIDIFIVETNLDNAKIIIENLCAFNFIVFQEGYEQFIQNISSNDKQILKIYEPNNNYFIFKNTEKKKSYRFNFNFLIEEDKNQLDKIVFVKHSNGMKMKITILKQNDFYQINKAITNLNLNIKIGNILISIIADNESKNKKLRNYKRNELLLMKLSNIKIDYNLRHQLGLFDNDKVNMKIFLEKFALYNQISKFGKFPCVCENITQMSYIEGEISNYKNSSMSKIKNLIFKMGKLRLNIDPGFIEEVINFFENILYRMQIIYFSVDELFLQNDRDLKIRNQFENYQKENSICYGTNISFPEIDIKFQLTEVGLEKLLYEKINCSDFFIWLGLGLVGKEQDLFLKKPLINTHLGSFSNLIQKILSVYKEQMSSEITNIGLKGLWGQIEHFFTKKNKTNKDCEEVQKNRYRIPRAFYGKYKYFTIYDKNDAYYFDKLEKKYKFEENGVYLYELLKGENNIYIFTNIFFFIFEIFRLENSSKVEYASIDKTLLDKKNIIVYFNDEGKKKNNCNELSIFCENKYIAEKVSKLLNDKYKNSVIN